MRSIAQLTELEELKIKAKVLLKAFDSSDASTAMAAAERLKRLDSFRGISMDSLAAERGRVQLKHALTVVALESGYPSWTDAKKALESGAPREKDAGDKLYPKRACGGLSRWFVAYEEARASLDAEGGFLLPYRNQFFICDTGHIEGLGLSPDDPDWEKIGFDWVKPKDLDARARLDGKLTAR
jgi:hypothetical protein